MDIRFAETLKQLRQEKGLTQEDVGNALGVANQTVSKWERGETLPDVSLLPALSAFFGVTVDRLLGLDREEDARRRADTLAFLEGHTLTETEAALAGTEAALRENPGDPEFAVRLMELLFLEKDRSDAPDPAALDRRLRDLWKTVRQHTDSPALLARADRLLADHLTRRYDLFGDREAMKTAQVLRVSLPALEDAKEYREAMDGGKDAGQKAVGELLYLLQNTVIRFYVYDPAASPAFLIDLLEKMNGLFRLLRADGGKNRLHLLYNLNRLGTLYAGLGEEEKALAAFLDAAALAADMDRDEKKTGVISRYYETEPVYRDMDMKTRLRLLAERLDPLPDAFRQSPAFSAFLSSLSDEARASAE